MNNLAVQEGLTELIKSERHNLVTVEAMQELETKLLDLKQEDAPVKHIFGAGIYIRELSVKAGIFVIGHRQKTEHMNHMVSGKILLLNDDGTISLLEAPQTFTCKAGRKIAMVLEDMIWHNIYPTDETDVEILEETYLDKSEYSQKDSKMKKQIDWLTHTPDRESYRDMLVELDITHDTVLEMSENEDDRVPFPSGSYKLTLSDSSIQGKGMFATSIINKDEVIAPARIDNKRTPAGRFVNHGAKPNAKMVKTDNGDIMLVATKTINGCHGGDLGEEITVDYKQAVKESGGLE